MSICDCSTIQMSRWGCHYWFMNVCELSNGKTYCVKALWVVKNEKSTILIQTYIIPYRFTFNIGKYNDCYKKIIVESIITELKNTTKTITLQAKTAWYSLPLLFTQLSDVYIFFFFYQNQWEQMSPEWTVLQLVMLIWDLRTVIRIVKVYHVFIV